MPIVVLHRERSEKLARRFYDALNEASPVPRQYDWSLLTEDLKEQGVAAFDSLIQDGLISEKEPGQ